MEVRPDSARVLREARAAQARFERVRRREASRSWGGWGGRCDEVVGRMCLRLEPTGDWWPVPDPPAVTEARERLLVDLAAAAAQLPGDPWILGQRVLYLAEADRRLEALRITLACAPGNEAWCAALRGYLLHLEARYVEAEGAFLRALDTMDPGEATRWADPRVLLDSDGRGLLGDASPEEREILARRFWEMADPLFLVEGNDRWTEHMARHVVVRAREDAVNPYDIRWGDDLAETVVRYGWEVGWERLEPQSLDLSRGAQAVGHQHPESRSHVPPAAALTALGRTGAEDWNPGSRLLPRTGYAPAYAPVFLPASGDLLRIPRGDSLILVAVLELPEDTSYHRAHGHVPLPVPPLFRGRPAEVGLFAQRGGAVVAAGRNVGARGFARIVLPPGVYLVSAEVWAPDSARAGRIRQGLSWAGMPSDLPTVSDLLVADGEGDDPGSLEEILDRLRFGPLFPGQRFRLAWELHGLGWRPETLRYHLDVRRAQEGILDRVGRFLRLRGEGRVVSLSWAEPGPEVPGPFLRSARVSLPPELAPGEYLVRLRVESRGRETLTVERTLRVVLPSR